MRGDPGIIATWYGDPGGDGWLGPVADRLVTRPPVDVAHWGLWRFGATVADSNSVWVTTEQDPRIRAPGRVRAMMTWLAALLGFLHQELVVSIDSVQVALSRAERRHPRPAARTVSSSVRVVRLRRVHRPDRDLDEPQAVDWSHRWMVSGHWRAQWYPSLNDHRLIYVNPYVKGPDDKPFVVKDVVFRVDR